MCSSLPVSSSHRRETSSYVSVIVAIVVGFCSEKDAEQIAIESYRDKLRGKSRI